MASSHSLLSRAAWLALASCSVSVSAFALQPVDLRCEQSVAPLDIDRATPRLSWRLTDEGKKARQSAYQVLVASRPDLLVEGKADLWDSGKQSSAASLDIDYKGRALSSFARVYWCARVWDGESKVSAWTPAASWAMGPLQAGDWKASWITALPGSESFLLRKSFVVKKGLVHATAYVSGLGTYELRSNGQKVGDAVLAPGWTCYDKTTLYDAYDLTDSLKEGDNAVGLLLGNSMYNVVKKTRFSKFSKSYGALRAIALLRLEYADGRIETIGTDSSWKGGASAVTFNSIYGGEDFDTRLEPKGWDRAGFDDTGWQSASLVEKASLSTLKGHDWNSQALRTAEIRTPVNIQKLADGKLVCDLGQNTSYLMRLRVTGPAGSSIRLTPSEVINEDGSINRNTTGGAHRGSSWWTYTKSTDAEETWTARFYYVGCRYVQVELLPAGATEVPAPGTPATAQAPKLEELQGLVLHADVAAVGDFSCSNELLNKIRHLVRWAQASNIVSVLTDCPHREKLGWIEQYHLNGPSIRYEFDVSRVFRKGMHDMADSQVESGMVPNVAPYYPDFKGTFLSAAEWGASFLLVPWQEYQFSGDSSLIAEHYPAMQRYVAYLESKKANGLLDEGLGDWYDLGPNKPGKAQLTPPVFTATAFLYDDYRTLARCAAVLGKADDAKRYTEAADALRTRFNQEFYNKTAGSYGTGSQCANAMALVMGLAEESERSRVLAALVADLDKHDGSMTAGDVGFRYLLLALAQNGRSDLVYRMINQDTKPGYGFQIRKGETSLCESWDANLGSSHNHFMLGQITEWFYHDLVGIQADDTKPGFAHVILHPTPVGDLTWAQGSYETRHGAVSLRWEKRTEGGLRVWVSLPANTSARLELPCSSKARITEGGKKLSSSATPEGRRAVELGSGNYQVLVEE